MVMRKALEKVRLEIPDSEEVGNFVGFIEESERGVCR
jgi:acyl-[acyl carrier protein]--UDP-N-acetylglucosamine O-acyltransferase